MNEHASSRTLHGLFAPSYRKRVANHFGRLALTVALMAGWPADGQAVSREAELRREWRQLTLPGLTIISDASPAQMKKWAGEIEWFRRAQLIAINLGPLAPEKPATIYLFSSERAMRPFLPQVDGKPIRVGAMFSEILGKSLGLVPIGISRFDTRERLFHELTHLYLRRAKTEIPLWFEEGMAQAMESFTLQGEGFRIGHAPQWAFRLVKISGTPPLEPLITRAELDYSRAGWKHGQTELFYAESAALTNMLLFRTKGGKISAVGAYLAALRQGLPAELAFKEGFGVTLAEAHAELDTYIRSPRWNVYTFRLDRTVDMTGWRAEPLSGPEIDRRMAALLVSTGQVDESMKFLQAALKSNPSDVEATELKAAAMVRKHGQSESTEVIGALVDAYLAGSKNPWIFCYLGYVTLDRFLPALVDETTQRPLRSMAFFQKALAVNPGMKFAYEGIAMALQARIQLSAAERTLLAEALQSNPNSAAVQLATANQEQIDGKIDEAKERLENLLRVRPDLPAVTRLQVRQMIGALSGEH